MTAPVELTPIWDVIAPLSRERDISAMEAACLRTAEQIRFLAPLIYHTIAVLILGLAFYSEDLDSMGDAINVLLFPDLSPSAGTEEALLARGWDAILRGGSLISFVDTSLLLAKQRVEPVKIWEAA